MPDRQVRVLRAAERFRTERGAISTTHELSFGAHYDPDRLRVGPLVAHNVETLPPGSGYEPHVHRDVEIVTWLVEGTLEHDDNHGNRVELVAPAVQGLAAAAGVSHSERNAAREAIGPTVRFVQMWLDCPPDEAADEGPSYASTPVDPRAMARHLIALAAGPGTGVTSPLLALRTPGVTLLAGEVAHGQARSLPDAPLLHVHVTRGRLRLRAGETADSGDSVTIAHGHAEHVVAEADSHLLVLVVDTAARSAGRTSDVSRRRS